MSSWAKGKDEACAWVLDNFKHNDTCLDVGACDGTWAFFLGAYLNMDGIEAHFPYIARYALKAKYRDLYYGDIRNFKYGYGDYELIIFGDIIEHLPVEDAQKVLDYAYPRCRDMLIAVPFLYEQGPINDNPFEEHLQPDLTHEVFMERFKGFKPLILFNDYGYYVKE